MPKPFKLTLHTWVRVNKLSFLSAMQAHQAVVLSDMIRQWSVWLRQGKLDNALPMRPDYREWLQLYRNHRHVFREAMNAFSESGMRVQPFIKMLETCQQISQKAKQDPESFKAEMREELSRCSHGHIQRWFQQGVRAVRKEYEQHLKELANMITGQDNHEDLTWFDQALRSSAELYFCMRVVLPCLIEYCMLPVDLLRQARNGDERAIERLLRLDDLVIHEPKVINWINGQGGGQRRARLDDATKWAKEGPIGQNSEWHFKECVGGLISAFSHHAFFILDRNRLKPQPLTAVQIRDLFDALYRDKQRRREAVMTDPDFARVNPESWSKAIARYRQQWERVLFRGKPDKK